MKLVSVEEMRAIEREADARGWTYADMMERAGLGLAEVVHSLFGYEDRLVALGLVGPGNNGGDTLVALAELASVGWSIRAYLVRPRPSDDPLVHRVVEAGGLVAEAEGDTGFGQLEAWLADSTVVLDGVLGTGVRLPLQPEIAGVLLHVRESSVCPPVVAVDCPSGVDCNSGEVADETIPAEVTVCMAAVKMGLLRFPAFTYCGEIQVVDIGLPEDLPTWNATRREVVSEDLVHEWLPERSVEGHKGTFGTVMVVAGSLNFSGAALLSAGGAANIGAGLVQLAVPSVLHGALAGANPNVTWVLLPHQMGVINGEAADVVIRSLGRATSMLVGPGLGLEDCTGEFVRRLLEIRKVGQPRRSMGFVAVTQPNLEESSPRQFPPLVFDADGLKHLAKIPNWSKLLPAATVLTPHPGEMAILSGLQVQEIQSDRIAVAQRFAHDWGHVVVLKGAFTVIASPDGRVGVIPVASDALAHGGTGDVLAGMIAGLLAQGMASYEAAAAAAWIHARAGLAAADHLGHTASVQASDLIDAIPEVLSLVW